MTRSDKGSDRFDYKIKWILQTAMVMTVFYTILWYYFPNTVVIEKKVYVYPVEELICGKKEKIVEYIASDCTPHTK